MNEVPGSQGVDRSIINDAATRGELRAKSGEMGRRSGGRMHTARAA